MELKIDADLTRAGGLCAMEGEALPLDISITGIFVRAQSADGRWHSVDIALLDAPSLLSWLRSRDGDNRWAEDTVGIILGHGHLHGR